MVITQLTGGLGNQLFQYAMARRLALHHRTELLVDTSCYGLAGEARPKEYAEYVRPLELFQFQVEARPALPAEIALLRDDFYRATVRDRLVRQMRRILPTLFWNKSHIVERRYRFQAESQSYPDNVYLQGFWQSDKYFSDITAIIRQDIQLVNRSIYDSASYFVANLKKQHPEVVSLHVRRGDLAHAQEALRRKNLGPGPPITKYYIDKARQQFAADTCFLVFSDSPKDILWCRENIRGKNLEFSDAQSVLWDFTAMSCCDHQIIANSTFSWWAAWLNDRPGRRVIAPSQWGHPGGVMVTDDLIPPDWKMI